MTRYVLHYAPDNASLIIRLVLDELGLRYDTRLVDRSVRAQDSAAYKALNPVGRIPVLETDQGPIFETAAIALWLADRHGGLAPTPDDPDRAQFLSWLFFLSNTVHSELRTLFYPANVVGPDQRAQDAVSLHTQKTVTSHFTLLDTECARATVIGADTPSLCDLYAATLLRWPALYPQSADRSWFDLARWPALLRLTRAIETRDSAQRAVQAEGLGPTPFSNPQPPNPPEGSAV
jgi:glutathione S-transferase